MAVAIPIALMAASAAASAAAARKEKKAANAARQLGAEGRDEFNRRNKANLDSLQLFAEDQYGAGRPQRWDAAAKGMETSRLADLQTSGANTIDTGSGAGMDANQLAWAGKVASDEGTRMRDVVKLLSKAAAPQTAGFDEGMKAAQFGSDYASRANSARQMADAWGVETGGRVANIPNAGAPQQLLSSLFAKGAMMYGGGGMGMGAGAHGVTGIPRGMPHVG